MLHNTVDAPSVAAGLSGSNPILKGEGGGMYYKGGRRGLKGGGAGWDPPSPYGPRRKRATRF